MVEELQSEGATKKEPKNLSKPFKEKRLKVHIDQVQFLEQFQQNLSQLVEEQVSSKSQKLVVFIDDLDRCLPQKAIQVLEAIKLFLDVPGCIYIFGFGSRGYR